PDIRFVYRQSPQLLVPQNSMHFVSESDPPNDVPGVATVVLDPTGRLIRLTAVPETLGRAADANRPPVNVNWAPLCAATAIPPLPHDTVAVWESGAGAGVNPRRVSGAALAGRPVYFDVSAPDTPP